MHEDLIEIGPHQVAPPLIQRRRLAAARWG